MRACVQDVSRAMRPSLTADGSPHRDRSVGPPPEGQGVSPLRVRSRRRVAWGVTVLGALDPRVFFEGAPCRREGGKGRFVAKGRRRSCVVVYFERNVVAEGLGAPKSLRQRAGQVTSCWLFRCLFFGGWQTLGKRKRQKEETGVRVRPDVVAAEGPFGAGTPFVVGATCSTWYVLRQVWNGSSLWISRRLNPFQGQKDTARTGRMSTRAQRFLTFTSSDRKSITQFRF